MDANRQIIASGFGAQLRSARESMRLSQKDAALRLHLNPSIIHILEEEDFEQAPPTTFLRGYIRSYARLLNFTEAEILAGLQQANLEYRSEAHAITPIKISAPPKSDRYVYLVSSGVLATVFMLVGIWLFSHVRDTATPVAGPVIAMQTATTPIIQQTTPNAVIPTTTTTNTETVATSAATTTAPTNANLSAPTTAANTPATTATQNANTAQPPSTASNADAKPASNATATTANNTATQQPNAATTTSQQPNAPTTENTTTATNDSASTNKHIDGDMQPALPEPGLEPSDD